MKINLNYTVTADMAGLQKNKFAAVRFPGGVGKLANIKKKCNLSQ